MRSTITGAVLGALVVALAGCDDSEMPTDPATDAADRIAATSHAADAATKGYEVTVRNLTANQPLTPPVIATHRGATDVFTVGEAASFDVKAVAENGNVPALVQALSADAHVSGVEVGVAGTPPPLLPGQSVTVEIEGSEGSRFLSIVSMLICTNDGFTGLDAGRLPGGIGDETTVRANAYDAGTEVNTEDFADLVPPCPVLTGVESDDAGSGSSDPALAEGGVIHHHGGIRGIADLTVADHGWTDPVAEISVKRIR